MGNINNQSFALSRPESRKLIRDACQKTEVKHPKDSYQHAKLVCEYLLAHGHSAALECYSENRIEQAICTGEVNTWERE